MIIILFHVCAVAVRRFRCLSQLLLKPTNGLQNNVRTREETATKTVTAHRVS